MAFDIKDLTSGALEALSTAVDKTPINKDTRNEMFKKICALIPNRVDNSTVISVFELLRKQQKLIKKDFSAALKKNQAAFAAHAAAIAKAGGYIEDQNSYKDVSYGDSTMQFSGCEIFATYNALFSLTGKKGIDLPGLISQYEKDGMVLTGKFGTAPKAIAEFFTKQGFKTVFSTDEKQFEQIAKDNDSLILTMYNDRDDISKEVHTVNISREGGNYTAHNVYCSGTVVGPYKSFGEMMTHINGGRAKGISLVGIKK